MYADPGEKVLAKLDKLPAELVIKFVLPHLGVSDLQSLTKVCSYLNANVKLFMQSFNTNVDLSTPSKLDLFRFITDHTSKLITVDLGGCENSPFDKQHSSDLKNMILRNKNLQKLYIPNSWISADVVEVLARDSPQLKTLQLSTFKIRLYDLTDENGTSRRLWPCSCWGTELELEEGFEFGKYFLPETLWRSKDENNIHETEERKLLNNLRLLRKNLNYKDCALFSMGKKSLMDPLDYHEHKCRRGIFYDGNNDQEDLLLHQLRQIFEGTDSERSDSENSDIS